MELTSELKDAIDQAAQVMARARHTVVLVGAGMSAESGVPTFRGPGRYAHRPHPPYRLVRYTFYGAPGPSVAPRTARGTPGEMNLVELSNRK